jgi:hypothetical protein
MADIRLKRVSGSDADERLAAKAALEAAEEQLRSLCASNAGTFVAVERRGRALEMALDELLEKVQSVELQVASTQEVLDQEEEGSENTLASLSEKHRCSIQVCWSCSSCPLWWMHVSDQVFTMKHLVLQHFPTHWNAVILRKIKLYWMLLLKFGRDNPTCADTCYIP